MKKLKLSELNLGNEAEVLTREQLKKVLGGTGSGGTTVGQTTTKETQAACCYSDNLDDCGRCMPVSMMDSCPNGQTLVTCVFS